MTEPGTFDGMVGNAGALRLLEGAIASGQTTHAYLFFGPAGVGKRTVARRFGAALVAGGTGGPRTGRGAGCTRISWRYGQRARLRPSAR